MSRASDQGFRQLSTTSTTTIIIEDDDAATPQTIDARSRRRMDRRPRSSLPYLPGLDGLRAVAVAVVVLYHAGVEWLPGGFLGVEMFFVLSGFLITGLLSREVETTGRARLPRFWMRRARRLLPALYALITGVLAWTLVADRAGLIRLRREIPAALTYVSNWVLISGNESYFEAVGRPSPLRHLWSLAIEEQFYLVWPVVFVLGLAVLSRRRMTVVILAGVVASTAAMMIQYEPFTDPSRVYYGTETRIGGLLIGAVLSLWWRPWDSAKPAVPKALRAAGPVGAIGMSVVMLSVGEFDSWLYRGGFVVVGCLTALLIVGTTTPTRLAQVLGSPALRWIGQRSYAIYLWHWPVVVFSRPDADVKFDGLFLLAYRVGLTVLLAALSYRFVELPWRLGRDRWAASKRIFSPSMTPWRRVRPMVPIAGLSVLLIAVPLLARAEPSESAEDLLSTASTIVPSTTVPSADVPATAPTSPPASAAPAKPENPEVLVVGDSVSLGAGEALAGALGDATIVDSAVGRQGPEGTEAVRRWIEGGWDGDALVIHLGNNGPVSPGDLDAMIDAVGDRPVVLVTVRVARPWESSSNDQIRAAADRHANVHLLDWRTESEGQPNWFGRDGIHLTPEGSLSYALLVTAALRA